MIKKIFWWPAVTKKPVVNKIENTDGIQKSSKAPYLGNLIPAISKQMLRESSVDKQTKGRFERFLKEKRGFKKREKPT